MSATLVAVSHGATMDDELLVDPTMPLGWSASTSDSDNDFALGDEIGFGLFDRLASYELSSVLIRSGDRIAVINDERVRVGDEVGAAVVASIEPDRVTLNVDGEIQTLLLYEDSIKTLVKGDE